MKGFPTLKGLMALTLHTIMHHSLTYNYMPKSKFH